MLADGYTGSYITALDNWLWRRHFGGLSTTVRVHDLRDTEGFSPLQRACRDACNRGMDFALKEVFAALLTRISPEALNAHTPHGAQPGGWAPVHFLACAKGGLHLLKILVIDKGANLSAEIRGTSWIYM